MTLPLMPKATAVWLIENTSLTFDQIAEFCGVHPLEVKGMADGEVSHNIIGLNPMVSGQLTPEEIKRCEENSNLKLELSYSAKKYLEAKKKKSSKYTPVARRQDKPDAISWFIKNFPNANEAQIAKLIGTTKVTIEAVKTKSHWNSTNIRPRDPVLLGLCTQTELDKFIANIKSETTPEENQSKND